MPFNGSGTFTLVTGNPVVTGTVISSTVQNNTMADLANGLTGCVTRTGQSAALSNLPMGGFKHTGAAPGASNGEYITYGQTSANLSSASIGTLSVTANASFNGNTVLGDAATDTSILNGIVTQPNMAAFRAYRSTTQSSGFVILFDVFDFQRTNGYVTGTGLWTTPVGHGGVYIICFNARVSNASGVSVGSTMYLSKNSSTASADAMVYDYTVPNAGSFQIVGSAVMSLNDGDTVSIRNLSAFTGGGLNVVAGASFSCAKIG